MPQQPVRAATPAAPTAPASAPTPTGAHRSNPSYSDWLDATQGAPEPPRDPSYDLGGMLDYLLGTGRTFGLRAYKRGGGEMQRVARGLRGAPAWENKTGRRGMNDAQRRAHGLRLWYSASDGGYRSVDPNLLTEITLDGRRYGNARLRGEPSQRVAQDTDQRPYRARGTANFTERVDQAAQQFAIRPQRSRESLIRELRDYHQAGGDHPLDDEAARDRMSAERRWPRVGLDAQDRVDLPAFLKNRQYAQRWIDELFAKAHEAYQSGDSQLGDENAQKAGKLTHERELDTEGAKNLLYAAKQPDPRKDPRGGIEFDPDEMGNGDASELERRLILGDGIYTERQKIGGPQAARGGALQDYELERAAPPERNYGMALRPQHTAAGQEALDVLDGLGRHGEGEAGMWASLGRLALKHGDPTPAVDRQYRITTEPQYTVPGWLRDVDGRPGAVDQARYLLTRDDPLVQAGIRPAGAIHRGYTKHEPEQHPYTAESWSAAHDGTFDRYLADRDADRDWEAAAPGNLLHSQGQQNFARDEDYATPLPAPRPRGYHGRRTMGSRANASTLAKLGMRGHGSTSRPWNPTRIDDMLRAAEPWVLDPNADDDQQFAVEDDEELRYAQGAQGGYASRPAYPGPGRRPTGNAGDVQAKRQSLTKLGAPDSPSRAAGFRPGRGPGSTNVTADTVRRVAPVRGVPSDATLAASRVLDTTDDPPLVDPRRVRSLRGENAARLSDYSVPRRRPTAYEPTLLGSMEVGGRRAPVAPGAVGVNRVPTGPRGAGPSSMNSAAGRNASRVRERYANRSDRGNRHNAPGGTLVHDAADMGLTEYRGDLLAMPQGKGRAPMREERVNPNRENQMRLSEFIAHDEDFDRRSRMLGLDPNKVPAGNFPQDQRKLIDKMYSASGDLDNLRAANRQLGGYADAPELYRDTPSYQSIRDAMGMTGLPNYANAPMVSRDEQDNVGRVAQDIMDAREARDLLSARSQLTGNTDVEPHRALANMGTYKQLRGERDARKGMLDRLASRGRTNSRSRAGLRRGVDSRGREVNVRQRGLVERLENLLDGGNSNRGFLRRLGDFIGGRDRNTVAGYTGRRRRNSSGRNVLFASPDEGPQQQPGHIDSPAEYLLWLEHQKTRTAA